VAKSKLKSGDSVIVIAGNDKGRTGTVRHIIRDKGRVVVEGINVRVKHKKPTQQTPQGERVEQEFSIHASNVMLLDSATGKGTRKRPQEG
jgi:large subunit ribosomal protein L24